jgi:lipoate-protein ligase A
LSFARPSAPYVCLGYHRGLDEVDQEYCRAHGLPVYRRMVGGGPVYLDDGQLFFQICLPAGMVPASRLAALRTLLQPAVTAFQAAGVAAELDEDTEICLGDRKICGHGAGQIEDAVVVCGNLIEQFDHQLATRVLALGDPVLRAETLRLMRRYVAATPADAARFQAAAVSAYAAALGLYPAPGDLTAAERVAVAELDDRFTSRRWLAGPGRPSGRAGVQAGPADGRADRRAGPAGRHAWRAQPAPMARQIKVRAGVWAFAARADGARVVASVVHGTVERVWLSAAGLNGSTGLAERALIGVPVCSAGDVLAWFGEPGRRLAAAFAAADRRRLLWCTPVLTAPPPRPAGRRLGEPGELRRPRLAAFRWRSTGCTTPAHTCGSG